MGRQISTIPCVIRASSNLRSTYVVKKIQRSTGDGGAKKGPPRNAAAAHGDVCDGRADATRTADRIACVGRSNSWPAEMRFHENVPVAISFASR